MTHRLSLVGPIETSFGEKPLPGFKSHKELWILLILAVHAGRPVGRRELMELVWGDEEDEPRKALSYALRNLRNAMGERSLIESDRRGVRMRCGEIDLDLVRFDAALQAREPIADDELHRGALAAGLKFLNIPEAGRRWLLGERVRRELAYHALNGTLSSLDRVWDEHRTTWGRHLSGDLDPEHEQQYRECRRFLVQAEHPADRQVDSTPWPIPSSQRDRATCIGREGELAMLAGLLAQHHLVTLWGTGGIGKTTLAQYVRDWVAPRYGGQAAWVSLADVGSPEMVEEAAAAELGDLPSRFLPAFEQIARALEKGRALLILDNAEHVREGVVQLVSDLQSRLPNLTVLVTSREPLKMAGERVVELCPLAVPAAGDTDPQRLLGSSSVQLFQQRAWSARPGWALTPETASAVADICRFVAGLPLAIELVTTACRLFSAGEIAARLRDVLVDLQGSADQHPSRHRNLGAVFDWSTNRLSEPARRLFYRLAVFRGGWTLADAEVVCEEPGALPLLLELSDRSLILREGGGASDPSTWGRFLMLEPVREYARHSCQFDAENMRKRHADHFLEMARRAEADLLGEKQADCLATLSKQQDNLRAALDWTVEAPGRARAALDLAASLRHFWVLSDRIREGRARVEAALGVRRAATHRRLYARALDVAAHLCAVLGDGTAALDYAQRALELSRKIGDARMVAHALNALGLVTDLPQAISLLEESERRFRALEDRRGIASTCQDLGVMAMHERRLVDAGRYLEESRRLYERLRHPRWVATVVRSEANLAYLHGDLRTARGCLQSALRKFVELNDLFRMAEVFEDLGLVEFRSGRRKEAIRLFAAAGRLRHRLGAREFGEGKTRFDGEIELQEGWEPAQFYAEWWRGWNAELSAVVHLALTLPQVPGEGFQEAGLPTPLAPCLALD